jgi:hypothetical protein
MFTNFFQDTFKPPKEQSPIGANTQTQLGANLPQFYQVAQNDTSMGQVATDNGFQLPDVVNANNGVKSLPPSGSYIQLPRPGFDATKQQQANSDFAMNAYRAGEQNYTPSPALNAGNATNASQQQMSGEKVLLNLQATISSGQAPGTVPASLLTSLGATPQSMTAAGYVFNSQTGVYTLPGGAATPGVPGGTGGGGGNPNAGKVYYSKSRGYVTYEVAKLLNKRRRRHAKEGNRLAREREAAAATAEASTGSTGVDQTVLALNLGSG